MSIHHPSSIIPLWCVLLAVGSLQVNNKWPQICKALGRIVLVYLEGTLSSGICSLQRLGHFEN
jgi:hypothetical protein